MDDETTKVQEAYLLVVGRKDNNCDLETCELWTGHGMLNSWQLEGCWKAFKPL